MGIDASHRRGGAATRSTSCGRAERRAAYRAGARRSDRRSAAARFGFVRRLPPGGGRGGWRSTPKVDDVDVTEGRGAATAARPRSSCRAALPLGYHRLRLFVDDARPRAGSMSKRSSSSRRGASRPADLLGRRRTAFGVIGQPLHDSKRHELGRRRLQRPRRARGMGRRESAPTSSE